jgi:hypothetical protein
VVQVGERLLCKCEFKLQFHQKKKSYPLSKFQVQDTELLAVVTAMCVGSPELTRPAYLQLAILGQHLPIPPKPD